jgi:Xaa-Pro aminopeptidase
MDVNRLVEGNVLTVEPGLYIPPDDAFPKHFHNIGIRIEVRFGVILGVAIR